MSLIEQVDQDTINVIWAPYGIDNETQQPHPPHPTQQKIREWVVRVKNGQHPKAGIPVLYCQHGVDSGGTRGVLSPVLELLFDSPGIRILIGRKDYQDLRLSVMETFFEMIPPILIQERDEQEHRYVIRGRGGTGNIFFRELKDTRGLGSQEFAVIVVSEAHEIDLIAYRTLKQRCRQAGFPTMILMEGNPPGYGHWLDKICNPQDADFDPDIDRLTLSSYENWNHMSPAYRQSLEQMPSTWRKRYLLGETAPLPSGTPVYPAFIDTVHVGPTQIIPDRPIIRGWDWGLRRAACCWAQKEDSGRLLIHREWLAMETPEEQFIDAVIEKTNDWFGARPCKDFGDPAARNRDPNGVSTLQRLQKRGIQLGFRPSTYGERIPLINRKLSEMIQGLPSVKIDPSCEILIEGFMGGYHFPEIKLEAAFSPGKDIPFKDGFYDHLMNAAEYVFVNLFGPQASGQAVRQFVQVKRERVRRYSHRRGSVVF